MLIRPGARRSSTACVLYHSILLALLLPMLAQAGDRAPSERDRSNTARLVSGLLSNARYAYRPMPLDDGLSGRIFDAYVDALDPGTRRSDVQMQRIEKHRFKLDDAVGRGRLDPIYEIADAVKGISNAGYDKDRALELFLNAYVKVSDGRGSYTSVSGSAAAKSSVGIGERPSPPSLSFVDAHGKRIGVIRLSHLHPTAGRSVGVDVAGLIARIEEKQVGDIVLDLRGNGGCPLREAVDLAGLFLGPVPVVQIREANGRVTTQAASGRLGWKGSLAVLVDHGTAAGAEILAAALQDHGRGVLVGEQSLGNGTLQNLIDLDRGSGGAPRYGTMTLTIAEVFRLDGTPLDGQGVVPDVPLGLHAGQRSQAASATNPIPAARDFRPATRPHPASAASLRHQDSIDRNNAIEDPALATAVMLLSRKSS